jgi:serine/threonine-protein kinase
MLFMEYVDGIPMNDPEFDRSLEDILELFAKAAEGFGAMHSAGFVHADIKPGNMLVTKDNKVKIIDYGQALGMREAKDRIQGTMDYIAPEQVRKKNLDQRTDVYGLGAALHRVITGKPIATDMNQNVDMDTMRHLGKRRDEITAPDLDDLPTPVVRLIENCTHTDPRERLKDMRAMAERTRLVREVLLRKKKADEEEERRHAAGNTASPALVDSDRPPDQSKNA